MTLESAIELACRLHAGQRDKGGETIICHVLRVMEAMHKHQWDQWEDARSPKDTNLHLEKYLRRQTTCHRAVKKFTSSHIAKLEIKP